MTEMTEMTEREDKDISDLVRLDNLCVNDLPFVLRSWICGMRRSPEHRYINGPIYYRDARDVVTTLLSHHQTQALVIRLKEDASSICAFVVYHPECLYWLYIKHAFRGFGLAKMLSEEADNVSKKLGYDGLKYYAFLTESGFLSVPTLKRSGLFVPKLLQDRKKYYAKQEDFESHLHSSSSSTGW
jgi:GNAT superfamily N-acetyltransferase